MLLALLTACGGGESNVVTGNRDGVLHYGNGAEPQGLDPHLVTGIPEHHVLAALYEGLVNLDPETLAPTPGVADAWEVSDDKLTYTFRLRPDAKWSNGDPVTAQDFLYAWRRILTPELGSLYSYMLHGVVNAKAYNDGELTEVRVQGAQLTGPFALAAHPQPRVWAATSAGLVAVDVDTLQPMERQEDVLATSLAADASGQVWATDGALLWERIGADDWTAYRPSVPARAVSAHPAGRGVWIHTEGPVVHATKAALQAGTRTVPAGQAVDALGRLLVTDASGLLRYGTEPVVAVAGLLDGAAIAAPRSPVGFAKFRASHILTSPSSPHVASRVPAAPGS